MSNKRKLRIPGRYERPPELRAPLGDHAGELGARAGYREGNAVRAAMARAQQSPLHIGGSTHQDFVSHYRSTARAARAAGRRVPTVESAPGAGTLAVARRGALALHESVGGRVTEAPAPGPTARTISVDVIRSGWNASGTRYYPAEVLERDVPRVYGKGTQMYIDHPSASEGEDLPERSLKTLAGKFIDDPWVVREDDGTVIMRTTAKVFGPWQPLIREAWDTIGVSINGNGRGDYGTRDGRDGLIIDELTYGRSVDFVTVPGAGGRVLGLLEADRPFSSAEFRGLVDHLARTREAGSLGAYVESRIHLGFTEIGDRLYADGNVTRPERITLSGAIGDALAAFVARIERDAPQLYLRGRYADPTAGENASSQVTAEAAAVRTREATVEQYRAAIDRALSRAYGGPRGYCWVQDFDPDNGIVWFTAGTPDDQPARTYQQSYITSNGDVVLVGDRVEVRARTVYEPVATADNAGGGALVADVRPYLSAMSEAARAPLAEAAAALAGRPDPWDDTAPQTTPPAPPARVRTTEATTGRRPEVPTDGPRTPANTTKEGDMPEKTAEVVAREAAEARATTAELKLARYEASEAAGPILTALLNEAADMPELAKVKVREAFPAARLPLTADNKLDEPALREAATAEIKSQQEYAAQLLEAAGVGTVRGHGGTGQFGSSIASTFGGGTATAEAHGGPDDSTREALIKQYMGGGRMTREAAEAAVNGRF
jgi:hypothetical protein